MVRGRDCESSILINSLVLIDHRTILAALHISRSVSQVKSSQQVSACEPLITIRLQRVYMNERAPKQSQVLLLIVSQSRLPSTHNSALDTSNVLPAHTIINPGQAATANRPRPAQGTNERSPDNNNIIIKRTTYWTCIIL